MTQPMKHLLTATALIVACSAATAEVAVTIYSRAQPGAVPAELYRPVAGRVRGGNIPGYAVVRDQRELTLKRGSSEVRISDVAALIDPTTVQFRALNNPADTRVLEQNFQFDLVSSERLLNRYIDQPIEVEQRVGDGIRSLQGTLLSTDGGLVLRNRDGGIEVIKEHDRIRFPELPGGLITRPTLVWQVASKLAGPQPVEIGYQTDGLTWWADYNLLLNEGHNQDACQLDLSAWVSILNRSGASYPAAKLKLVAGDVQRVQPPGRPKAYARTLAVEADAAGAGFAEKAFFEYHLYTLQRPTDVADNATKQIELFPAVVGVPCQRQYRYAGGAPVANYGRPMVERPFGMVSNSKVDVALRFENRNQDGLGIPLPAGRLRVSKRDADDGAIEFIGEDVIDHTPKDEPVDIRLGSAFDIVGERKQLNFDYNKRQQRIDETIEIKLRNHKATAVTVDVVEKLSRWTGWEISHATDLYEKKDHGSVVFPIQVPADGESVLRYTVRYEW